MLTQLPKHTASKLIAPTLSVLLTAYTLTVTSGCTTEQAAPPDDTIALSIETPEGGTQDVQLRFDDLAGLTAAYSLPFLADGTETTEPTTVFTASTLEFQTVTGKHYTYQRQDRRFMLAGDEGLRGVQWSEDFTRLHIDTYYGVYSLNLSRIANRERRQMVMAYLMVATLGNFGGSTQEVHAAAMGVGEGVVIIVGILATAWLICITAGNLFCAATAVASCGEGNVESYAMNCGVSSEGADFNGIGTCEFTCKPTDGDPGPGPGGPLPPGTWTPVPPEQLPEDIGCPEGTHPDFCIVGYSDSSTWDADAGELTVTSEAVVEPCCAADGAQDAH